MTVDLGPYYKTTTSFLLPSYFLLNSLLKCVQLHPQVHNALSEGLLSGLSMTWSLCWSHAHFTVLVFLGQSDWAGLCSAGGYSLLAFIFFSLDHCTLDSLVITSHFFFFWSLNNIGCEAGVLGYRFVSLRIDSFQYLIQFQVSNAISKLMSQLSSGNLSLSAGLSFNFCLAQGFPRLCY